ncbi:SDR family oxidoreductase [Nitrospirillum viridazoti]|uniref:Short-chain dehydrogenase n=1 Tax=Nitrospirillum viridazoti CBAmc TaxID=1441467 RepID=A0A248JVN2_9PROT|nr:SDR family oxidoreductase [Nitrospirillum amazonense]ASG22772.1 short-chain dehydrogenase [Nitrospirillum amazonense CBAmc]TWB33772.1 NAD(P)-dependent dehydrogenase (short-subunit alcohol dehydrogenase family) [Nitrospirillum amazonense]
MSKFNGKIALVTGGTSGIGLATVSLLRAEGAEVIAVGTNPERLAAARKIVGDNGLVLAADLRKQADIDGVIQAVSRRYGKLDIVHANAGLGLAAPLEAVTEEQIDEQFGVNFKGLFFTIQKAAPLLVEGGSIVLTTSWLNAVGTPGLSILSATKAAVRSLTRSLAAEFAPRGIRVNAVSPGPIATPFVSKVGLDEATVKAFADAIVTKVPLHRFGGAEEVARAVLFLAGSDSAYVTGTEVVVDGGLSQI